MLCGLLSLATHAATPPATSTLGAGDSSLQQRIEQLEQRSSDDEQRMGIDEGRIDDNQTRIRDDHALVEEFKKSVAESVADFRSHEDRYLTLSGIVVGGIGGVFTLAAILISVFSFYYAKRTEETFISKSEDIAARANGKIQEYDLKFVNLLRDVEKASADARSHAENSQQHLQRGRQDADAIAGLRQEIETMVARLRDHATRTLFESQFGVTPGTPPPAERDNAQEAADLLAKFSGHTRFDTEFESGLVAQAKNDYDAALAAFRRATENAPDDLARAKALYSIATTLVLRNREEASQDQALSALNEVISLQSKLLDTPGLVPLLAHAHMLRAELLRQRGDLSGATSGFTWIIDRFADNADQGLRILFSKALVQRGLALITRRDYQRAIEDFDLVLEKSPNPSEPELRWQFVLSHYNKSRALAMSKQWTPARDVLQATLRLVDDATDARSRMVREETLKLLAEVSKRMGDAPPQ